MLYVAYFAPKQFIISNFQSLFAIFFVPLQPHLTMYPVCDEGGKHLKDVIVSTF